MSLSERTHTVHGSTRADIRKEIVNLFLQEEPGTGTGENCTKYWYKVETLNEYSIILKRPVPLNKGFDFTVNVDGLFFKNKRRYTHPSHSDIFAALNYVRENNSAGYAQIRTALTKIYECQPYDRNSITGFSFLDYQENQHPIEIILLATKWLFIEQDITYWNWSGRNMLWNFIKDI